MGNMKKTMLRYGAWVRHVMWEEATVSAFLHNCSSPPRFPPQAGARWWCERHKHVVFSWSDIEECTNTSARQTKYLSTVCRKLYQRVMCYERQLDVLRLQGLVLGVFRLVLSGI